MNEAEAYLGFSLVRGIGPARSKLLIEYFGTAHGAFTATQEELKAVGLGDSLITTLISFQQEFKPQAVLEHYKSKGISVITRADTAYPPQLLQIPDPPLVLYIIGSLPTDWSHAIGVVGTRMPTAYGIQMTTSISHDLAQSGCLIISGLAKGVDGIAHSAAVEAQKPTVAVLGCGVDIIYPPEHKDLYYRIIKTGGAIISEVPPGHTVARGLFPARNRIISGLSKGIIVTEGAEDSGSLITASCAVDQGKDVFAVPGLATSHLSGGPIKLIKQGAKLVTSAADVFQEYGWGVAKINKKAPDFSKFSQAQRQVLATLITSSLHCDEIVRQSQIKASEVMTIITTLELSGILINLGNGIYGLK